jgi:hypothetical protein
VDLGSGKRAGALHYIHGQFQRLFPIKKNTVNFKAFFQIDDINGAKLGMQGSQLKLKSVWFYWKKLSI